MHLPDGKLVILGSFSFHMASQRLNQRFCNSLGTLLGPNLQKLARVVAESTESQEQQQYFKACGIHVGLVFLSGLC